MRKPAAIEMAGGKGLRQRIWERIRAREGRFCLRQLVRGGESLKTCRDYVAGLERAGYLRRVAGGNPGQQLWWELVRDVGAEAPRVRRDGSEVTAGRAQEAMWRTLRIIGECNARELAAMASTQTVAVSEIAARDYLRHLHRAGYLVRTRKGQGRGCGGTQSRYRLKPGRWTGPRAPLVCRTKAVFDPNLGEMAWTAIQTDEDVLYGGN